MNRIICFTILLSGCVITFDALSQEPNVRWLTNEYYEGETTCEGELVKIKFDLSGTFYSRSFYIDEEAEFLIQCNITNVQNPRLIGPNIISQSNAPEPNCTGAYYIFEATVRAQKDAKYTMEYSSSIDDRNTTYRARVNLNISDFCSSNEVFRVYHYHRIQNHRNGDLSKKKLLDVASTSSTDTPFKVSADGSSSSIFKIEGLSNYRAVIMNDPNGSFIDRYGVITQNGENELIYTHPTHNIQSKFGWIEIGLLNNTDGSILETFNILIYPAPVLTIHGVWSEGESFKDMRMKALRSGYSDATFTMMDYYESNDSSFQVNAPKVLMWIDDALLKARSAGIAAGALDLVGHSMGGILSRIYIQSDEYKNDVRRLITINTPHSGSQGANFLINGTLGIEENACNIASGRLSGCSNGAVEDLSVGSSQLDILNGPLKERTSGVLKHGLVSTAIASSYTDLAAVGAFTLNPTLGIGIFSLGYGIDIFLSSLFNDEAHDIIVSLSSQQGGLPTDALTIVENQAHIGAQANNEAIEKVIELLMAHSLDTRLTPVAYRPDTLEYTYDNKAFQERVRNLKMVSGPLILSPSLNMEYYPGDTLKLIVDGGQGTTSLIAFVEKETEMAYRASIDTNQYKFELIIDSTSIGRKKITVGAYDSITNVYTFDTTSIIIKNNLKVDSIFSLSTASFFKGQTKTLSIYGRLNGTDKVINLTGSDLLTLTSSTGLVLSQGGSKISSDSSGLDRVVFSYDNEKSVEIDIIVHDVVESNCFPSLDLGPGLISGGTYFSESGINIIGKIASGEEVSVYAPNQVTLDNLFEIEHEASLEINIGDCSSNQ